MSEKYNPTSPKIAREAGGIPEEAQEMPSEKKIENPEIGMVYQSVLDLKPGEVFELISHLKQVKVNIRQKSLQRREISRGYRAHVMQINENQIGIRPNQNNILVVGTPQEFLDIISQYENL